MLSDSDTRAIQGCREVLRDLATAARREPRTNDWPSDVFAHGMFAAYCLSAEHHLSYILTHADTYLDDVHAAAAERGQRSQHD